MSKKQIFEVIVLDLSVMLAVAKTVGQLDKLPELSDDD